MLFLKNRIPKDLPAAWADENRLQQILHNLIGNAIKFTKEGQVVVNAEVKNDMLCISVSDTGIGIDAEKLGHIFEAFTQADDHMERQAMGTGLGLAITKNLVEHHGGDLCVESEPGEGSTFYFTLPISKEAAVPKSQKQAAPRNKIVAIHDHGSPHALPNIPKRSGHILIVDDDRINLQVLRNHLTLLGYQLSEASSGDEALEFIERHPNQYNLILLDVMMNGLSGYETCRRIREKYSLTQLPVLLLTAKNQLDDLIAGFDAGCNDFLTKPVNKHELIYRVNTHMTLQALHADLDIVVQQRTRELEARNRDLETLDTVVRNVNRELDWEAQAQALLDQAMHFVEEATKGVLFLRTMNTKEFCVAAVSGYDKKPFANMCLSEQQLLRHQQGADLVKTGVWQVADLDAASPNTIHPPEIEPPKSSLGIALHVGKSLQGYLVLDHPMQENVFEDQDLVRFKRFREHASSAVARAIYVRELMETSKRLRQTQDKLVQAAHRAGMAEMAIDVLHNIGNSLTSINTAHNHLRSLVNEKRILKLLENIVALLQEKSGELAHFLTEDKRGQTIPNALERIVGAMSKQSQKLDQELYEMGEDIETLRDIVAAQERYAQGSDLNAVLSLDQVLQEAISINRELMKQAQIELVMDEIPALQVSAPRYRLISVFDHLIRNAIEAITTNEDAKQDRMLRIRLQSDQTNALLVIEDTGIGMQESQIVAAFRHGYSTKSGSKGFGLHFCANAIKDLSGEIKLTSDGPGEGSQVSLRLPLVMASEPVG